MQQICRYYFPFYKKRICCIILGIIRAIYLEIVMSKQTAVEWLWNELKAYNVNIASDLVAQFNQAKQMECHQIAKAWNDRAIHLMGIDYYHETYGGDHE